MSIDGRWEIILSSPIGEQKGELTITSTGSGFTGSMVQDGTTLEITDGRVDGDKISWSVAVTSPMKLTLKSTATVSGDTMTGKAKPGIMPGMSFTGTRVG
ncbi:hypothetical protein CcI49_26855 [Frankia sp. CcI49]|uniref:hypothetical protein n=1 Tax=unclassified Frankia TaxID=2632575 RepID=UPI0006C9EF63|nr:MULTISPECIES: hypothetical protein [unclassified Frankia]KPM56681.1 hypothetical protein ACG83_01965 [Frankia sp. R43]ONH57045.1 hypothetical protein CcI49_26855 [Frankia sp. CcI49]